MKINVQDQINREQVKFEKYLDSKGLKLTKGRQIIFDEVMCAHGHFAAEDLIRQCQKHNRNVSRATLYRILRELLESGVIRETAYGEKHHHYEHIYDEQPHHHARCIRCGDMLEFPDLQEDQIYHPILKQKGFTVLGHEMHFYGICKKCND